MPISAGRARSRVPLGDSNASMISSILTAALDTTNSLYPSGPCVTNIDAGLTQASGDPGLADTARKSYLMLVTDGGQSKTCDEDGGDTGSEQVVQTLQAAGVDTFVVGFGSEVKADFLNTLASLGGEALTGSTQYYQADTAGDLDMAFQSIASQVVSCQYTVNPAPPDPSQIYVWFDRRVGAARSDPHERLGLRHDEPAAHALRRGVHQPQDAAGDVGSSCTAARFRRCSRPNPNPKPNPNPNPSPTPNPNPTPRAHARLGFGRWHP